MLKKHCHIILLFLCVFCASCRKDPIETEQSTIVVLFENDVHCAIDGYTKLAGLRDAIKDTAYVAVVSSGDFVQVSGLKYTATVSDHSLSDVLVQHGDGAYEPIDPERTYTVAVLDYCVVGDGFQDVFNECTVIQSSSVLYCDLFTNYVLHTLHGNIGVEYARPQGRITIID